VRLRFCGDLGPEITRLHICAAKYVYIPYDVHIPCDDMNDGQQAFCPLAIKSGTASFWLPASESWTASFLSTGY